MNGLTPPDGLVSKSTENAGAKFVAVFLLVSVLFFIAVAAITINFPKRRDNQSNKDNCDSNQTDSQPVVERKTEENGHTPDKFEELKKYKELLDLGIITQEEFEVKKKELLGDFGASKH